VITLPYCFLNSEVRGVVRTRWDRWQLIRSVGADVNGSNRTSGSYTVVIGPGGTGGSSSGVLELTSTDPTGHQVATQ
jgi:hypothetical protein